MARAVRAAGLLLASVEAELGDLAEAARLSSDVCASLTRTEGMLAAEAFWVAATVNTRQGTACRPMPDLAAEVWRAVADRTRLAA
jgi:hypothetical protein